MTETIDPRLRDYLGHILEAIERINRYTAGMDRPGFQSAEQTQDAVIRNFEIIGEASRNIEQRYPEFARRHAAVPWGFAYEMRNALAHGYFRVDLGIVWDTIQADLPGLAKQVMTLRDGFPNAEDN
jgi:uncharacterized protein with HEPN domain